MTHHTSASQTTLDTFVIYPEPPAPKTLAEQTLLPLEPITSGMAVQKHEKLVHITSNTMEGKDFVNMQGRSVRSRLKWNSQQGHFESQKS